MKVASLDPAMVMLEPTLKLTEFAVLTVAMLLLTLMVLTLTAALGVRTDGAGPAVAMATPFPTAKSLVPPEHVIEALLAAVLQVIVGGVKLLERYPP